MPPCVGRLTVGSPAGSAGVVARGHGDADKPADGYSLAASADDIVAFMDALGFDSAVLLGPARSPARG